MKCVLHIGLMKTGSSLIQQWLIDNKQQLSLQKICLSEISGKPDNHLFTASFHDTIDDWTRLMRIATTEDKRAYFAGFHDRLRQEIDELSKSHTTYIITSEHLSLHVTRSEDIGAMAEFLRTCFEEVKVVCYFRNQFDFAVSAYSTILRHGAMVDLATHLSEARPEFYHYDYFSIAERWSTAFGIENCDFRIYDKSVMAEGDLRKNFMTSVGHVVDFSPLDMSLASANEALSVLLGSAYRAINCTVPFWDSIDGGVSHWHLDLKTQIAGVEGLKIGRIESSLRADVEQAFDEVNTKFFGKFFSTSNQFKNDVAKSDAPLMVPLSDVETLVFDLVRATLSSIGSDRFLRDDDARCLRDAALGIEGKVDLKLQDSLALMKLARRARPNGPFIGQKIEEYEARLRPQEGEPAEGA